MTSDALLESALDELATLYLALDAARLNVPDPQRPGTTWVARAEYIQRLCRQIGEAELRAAGLRLMEEDK